MHNNFTTCWLVVSKHNLLTATISHRTKCNPHPSAREDEALQTPKHTIYPFLISGKGRRIEIFHLFCLRLFFLLTSLRLVHTIWSRLSLISHHTLAESVFGWYFHNCGLKLIAFDIWHSSSRNLFLIIQIIITKEINKSYFFIMDAIIKKFPGSIDVSHEANRINKSDLGTYEDI